MRYVPEWDTQTYKDKRQVMNAVNWEIRLLANLLDPKSKPYLSIYEVVGNSWPAIAGFEELLDLSGDFHSLGILLLTPLNAPAGAVHDFAGYHLHGKV